VQKTGKKTPEASPLETGKEAEKGKVSDSKGGKKKQKKKKKEGSYQKDSGTSSQGVDLRLSCLKKKRLAIRKRASIKKEKRNHQKKRGKK